MTSTKFAIVSLLFLGKVLGRVVGFAARTQTRLLTRAQSMGWKPTDREAFKLMRRQQQLFQYDMTRKQMKLLRKTKPKLLEEIQKTEKDAHA